MKKMMTVIFAISTVLSTAAFAGELDQDKAASPKGVLVRVDAKTHDATVYKVAREGASIEEVAKAENIVSEVKSFDLNKKSELDNDKSTSAWCYYYYGNYYTPYSYFTYYTPYTYYTYNYSYAYNYAGYYWYWYHW